MLTMKISYEKLNQIIEEEVARFKRLNEVEVATKVDTKTLDGAKALLQNAITSAKDLTQLKAAVSAALGNIG